jgi:hypothetical protein
MEIKMPAFGFRSFFEQFSETETEIDPTLLRVTINRYPMNDAVTEFHFDHAVDVAEGQMRFKLNKDGELKVDDLLSCDKQEPTTSSLALASQLLATRGVTVGSRSFSGGQIEINTYSILLYKAVALPDDTFEHAVITTLADFFQVSLDKVQVSYKNQHRMSQEEIDAKERQYERESRSYGSLPFGDDLGYDDDLGFGDVRLDLNDGIDSVSSDVVIGELVDEDQGLPESSPAESSRKQL